jgi:hypothetical protein
MAFSPENAGESGIHAPEAIIFGLKSGAFVQVAYSVVARQMGA